MRSKVRTKKGYRRRMVRKGRPVGSRDELLLYQRQLWPEVPGLGASVPWVGASPRSLTKCGKLFSLGAPPPGGLVEDPNWTGQYLLFTEGKSNGT